MNIEIAAHSPYWKLYYNKEEQQILKHLKVANISTKIAHIGSTAVPNLSAQPTIDILLGLAAEANLDDCIAVFQKMGYIYVSKYNDLLPQRRFFIKIKALSPLQKWEKKEIAVDDRMPLRTQFQRNFEVYVVHRNSLFYEQQIAFRNHLRTNEADRRAYGNLKEHLSRMNWESEDDYAQAKSGFIVGVMGKLGYR